MDKISMIWTAVPTNAAIAPTPRYGASLSKVKDSLYCIGGIENGVRVNSVMKLNLKSFSWSKCEIKEERDLPVPRAHHACWEDGNLIFIHGGEGSSLNEPVKHLDIVQSLLEDTKRTRRLCYDDLYSFNTETNKWSRHSTKLPPLARKGHTVTLVKGGKYKKSRVILFGGAPGNAGHPFNDLFIMDSDQLATSGGSNSKDRPTWVTSEVEGTPPSPRFDHSCTVLADQSLLYFGGTSSQNNLYNDIFMLHTNMFESEEVLMRWSCPNVKGSIPKPCYGHSSDILSSRTSPANIVIFGGIISSASRLAFSKDVYNLNLETLTWTLVDVGHAYPQPRYGHSMVKLNNSLLIYGGMNTMYCTGDIWKLEPKDYELHHTSKKDNEMAVLIGNELQFEAGHVLLHRDLEKLEKLVMDTRREKLALEERIASEYKARQSTVGTLEEENNKLRFTFEIERLKKKRERQSHARKENLSKTTNTANHTFLSLSPLHISQELRDLQQEFEAYKNMTNKNKTSVDSALKKSRSTCIELCKQLENSNRLLQLLDISCMFRQDILKENFLNNKKDEL